MGKQVRPVERMTVRFAGDSGDGMRLLGGQFTLGTAFVGNDLATLPSFPAEIRAPAGTLPGVSSFQIQYADHATLTPGEQPDVLVAMNPAALRANLPDRPGQGGDGSRVLVHDAHEEDPSTAFALARRTVREWPGRGPIGVFRAVDRPANDDQVRAQCRDATERGAARSLAQVIAGTDTWRVGRTA